MEREDTNEVVELGIASTETQGGLGNIVDLQFGEKIAGLTDE